MAITIDVQENPKVSKAGKKEADATVINSGFTSGTTKYHVRRKDRQDEFILTSTTNISTYSQVLSISASRLKIILPGRQWYEVRVRNNSGAWSEWTSFKTRDKVYVTPVAIHTARAGFDTNPTLKTSKTLQITNVGKSTVVNTSAGATVTNTDTVYNGTTSIVSTNAGATVTTDNYIGTPTNTGVTMGSDE